MIVRFIPMTRKPGVFTHSFLIKKNELYEYFLSMTINRSSRKSTKSKTSVNKRRVKTKTQLSTAAKAMNNMAMTGRNHDSGAKENISKNGNAVIGDNESMDWRTEYAEMLKDEEHEETDEEKEKRKRHESAMKAVKTKRLKTIEQTKEAISKIHVERIHKKNLLSITLSDQEDVYERDGKVALDVYDASPEVQERWMVNFIRHVLTEYNHELWSMKGKIGASEAYVMYKSAVLDRIAVVYPYLRAECERQKVRLLSNGNDTEF